MIVYAYWDRDDSDSKKIYKFFGEFQKELAAKYSDHNLFIDTLSTKTSKMLNGIRRADVLLFFTHGTNDRILLRRNKIGDTIDDVTLIDIESFDLIKNKIIIAMCCDSLKDLGCHQNENGEQCKVYIGFRAGIQYDFKNRTDSMFRGAMYSGYNQAFEQVFREALSDKLSAKEFVARLKAYIIRMCVAEVLSAQDHQLGSPTQVIIIKETADSLGLFGDENTILFA